MKGEDPPPQTFSPPPPESISSLNAWLLESREEEERTKKMQKRGIPPPPIPFSLQHEGNERRRRERGERRGSLLGGICIYDHSHFHLHNAKCSFTFNSIVIRERGGRMEGREGRHEKRRGVEE